MDIYSKKLTLYSETRSHWLLLINLTFKHLHDSFKLCDPTLHSVESKISFYKYIRLLSRAKFTDRTKPKTTTKNQQTEVSPTKQPTHSPIQFSHLWLLTTDNANDTMPQRLQRRIRNACNTKPDNDNVVDLNANDIVYTTCGKRQM